jgi:pimeloyl-ACP methyl ester carboxylesterase
MILYDLVASQMDILCLRILYQISSHLRDTPILTQNVCSIVTDGTNTLVFATTDRSKQTYTLGEFVTLTAPIGVAANFTGPVDIVLGENDFIFCQANCSLPVDQAVATLHTLYPAAGSGSQTVIFTGIGHGINVHYDAPKAFAQTVAFFDANGF